MRNNIKNMAKLLRNYAKRCKNVKYSINLLITFLLAGKIVVPNSNNDLVNKNEDKDVNNNEKVLKKVKKNNSLIQNTNNELIQLVANGDKAINLPGETEKTKADYSFEIERMNNSIVTESSSKEGTIFSMGIEPSKMTVKSLVDKEDSASLLVSADKNAITTDKNILNQKQTITNSISDIRTTFKKARSENNKLLKGANLELVQLMEQGDQVVKSPWSSWQFGMNYFFNTFNGTYNGRGDKSEKYPYEGVFTRGNWWERNVSPESSTYERVAVTDNPFSTSTKTRKDLGLVYGLVGSREVPDLGVPLIIEPTINVRIPAIPNLNINPTVVSPSVSFSIPDVSTVVFTPTELPVIRPNVFNPPALDQVATGFAQDMSGMNFYLEPNVIVNNATGTANANGTEITITDDGFSVDGAFGYTGRKDNTSGGTVQDRSGRVTATNPQVTGTVDGTWKFNESNPKPDNSTLTSAHGTSNIVNPTQVYNNAHTGGASLRTGAPSSPQTVFSFTQYQQDIGAAPGNRTSTGDVNGNWVLRNTTSNPIMRNKNYTNTLRFISVNGTHVYSFYDPNEVNLNGNVNVFGRSAFDTLGQNAYVRPTYKNPYEGWTHMTVAVEQQAASAKESIFNNNGVITLEREAAKPAVNASDDAKGSFLIGFAAMVEDYGQYQPLSSAGNVINSALYSNVTYRPWASEMNNNGMINVNSMESIGIDFSEFNFNPVAGEINGVSVNPLKVNAWGNKGSLRIYMNTGDINVTSEDAANHPLGAVRGSYGIRVPNVFNGGRRDKTVDTEGIYYDETIIDGDNGTVTLTGSHNVGVSISKRIGGSGTGTNATTDTYAETSQSISRGPYNGQTYTIGSGAISTYNYQTGKGANGNASLAGLGTTHGVTTAKNLDNTGRDENDLIGNIYNLQIVVDGQENVGFLRNADYMQDGAYGGYSAAAKTLAQNDFNIKDTHVKSINFTSSTDGGTLFRTDRYGINLEKNLTGAAEVKPGNATAGRYNIVMLANGEQNPTDTVVPKVKNTGEITVASGGQNVIGLMAYNGGRAEVVGDLTIKNSPTSIGLVVSGSNTRGASSGESSGNITVTGQGSAGVYNHGGLYEMTGGSIKANGAGTIAVYASTDSGTLAETVLGSGTVEATGTGAVALYANGGSDIELNGTTLTIGNGGLLFYGSGTSSDESQLYITGDATANVGAGGIAFYVKSGSNSPLASIRRAGSTGTLTLNMATGSTLIVAEGSGGNTGGELVSNLSSTSTGNATGITVNGTVGDYVPYKASRVHLIIDQNSNLDNPTDAYLKSEFSSSSMTINNGVTVSGSGAITSPTALANKAKVAIAQKNSTVGVNRNDVILTNNGTINLTGTGMAGIVGEYAQIDNNSVIKTTGDNSTGIITTNGGIATNNGSIEVGNSGVGIAGINYLGVTDSTYTGGQPATGKGFIEIVHNGSITSTGTSGNIFGILGLDKTTSDSGTPVTAEQASSITLNSGSTIDVSSVTGGTGVYSEGAYRSNGMATVTDNGSGITLGTNGVGFYLKGAELTATGGTITSANNATAQGIFTDSDVTSAKNITLLGDKSIGIHNYGVNTQYPTNKGRSYVNITNSGTITLGNSANINNPSIGIYTKYGNVDHYGTITGGTKTLGILSDANLYVNVANGGTITLGDGAVGIYKKQGTVTLGSNSNLTVGNNAVGVIADNGAAITNNSTNVNIGNTSFGFALLNNGNNTYNSTAGSKVNMGSNSVYLYNAGTGTATTRTDVYSTGNGNAAIYTKDGNTVNNYGTIDYSAGIGNIGAYAENGSIVNNFGTISIGKSTITQGDEAYSIGMATIGGTINNKSTGTINVTGDYGIGMFAQGSGSRAENDGTINVSGVNGYGMYIDGVGAVGINRGTIRTTGSGNSAIGVAVLNGATFENEGTVDINLDNSTGIYIKDAVIKNYGTIRIAGTGSMGVRSKSGRYEDASGNVTDVNASNLGNAVTASNGAVDLVVESAFDPSVSKGSTSITPVVDANGNVVIKAYVNGEEVPVHDFTPGPSPEVKNYAFSNVGIYVDTLGRTTPIDWVDGYNPLVDNDLIVGTEITEQSTSKAIRVGSDIITPFLNSGQQIPNTLNVRSAALTWVATPSLDPATDLPTSVTMTKVPYTDFVAKTENAWNFADGLEQRYGVEGIGTREKKLFDKLNNIGQNEQVLLTQAYDEMMGHQYANVQQRTVEISGKLSKEINHLMDDWRNPSKENNKVKTFGMSGEYKTDTAGIIDYKSNTYGVVYVHEDETIKLGNSTGWYAGYANNRNKFKDIGRSKETTNMLKLGVFKKTAFDNNGSLQWTISGEGYAAKNDMKRRFLVVDEIFGADSTYYTYGVSFKNELSKDFRLSERSHLKAYGSIDLGYGRFSDIKEDKGEVRLEVDSNDYYSIKPEVGLEFKYVQPFAKKAQWTASLGIAYENELGKINDVDNRARVRYTSADWFGIRGEKENRKGNVKADFNLGIDNQRVGFTLNAGYDTNGENFRGGIGLRAIF